MSAAMQYKALAAEFKADGEQGVYDGHFSVFGNVDDGGDKMHAGAFAKTIVERGKRVKVFYAHDWSKLLGPPPEILEEDARGLHVKGRLTLDSFWGREAWALMKDGALTEASIGYEAVKWDYEAPDGSQISEMDAWNTRGVVRNLREVKLYEVSPVPLGMNALAEVEAIKAALAHGQQGDLRQEPLDTYLATLSRIGQELKAGRVLSAANKTKVESAVSALKDALDALTALLAAADPDDGKAHQSALLRRARAAAFDLDKRLRGGAYVARTEA